MIFENEQIDLTQLPQATTVQWQPLSKKYLLVERIGNLIFFAFLLVGLIILLFVADWWSKPLFLWGGFGLWGLLLILAQVLIGKGFRIKGYALREKDILYKSGLIFRKETALPLNRVQHCEITEGLIERSFDLATLKVFTAGGQSSDLVISGLTDIQAQQLKTFITKKTGRSDEEE